VLRDERSDSGIQPKDFSDVATMDMKEAKSRSHRKPLAQKSLDMPYTTCKRPLSNGTPTSRSRSILSAELKERASGKPARRREKSRRQLHQLDT